MPNESTLLDLQRLDATAQNKSSEAVTEISAGLNALLADVFALFIKTKNFHWHMGGPNFRSFHLMLDEHADQLFSITDEAAERVRKIGGTTIRSVGQIARLKSVLDNDADFVAPAAMLSELYNDEQALASRMLSLHELCGSVGDVATASLLETWIDQSQRRSWFLLESTRP